MPFLGWSTQRSSDRGLDGTRNTCFCRESRGLSREAQESWTCQVPWWGLIKGAYFAGWTWNICEKCGLFFVHGVLGIRGFSALIPPLPRIESFIFVLVSSMSILATASTPIEVVLDSRVCPSLHHELSYAFQDVSYDDLQEIDSTWWTDPSFWIVRWSRQGIASGTRHSLGESTIGTTLIYLWWPDFPNLQTKLKYFTLKFWSFILNIISIIYKGPLWN